MKLAALLVAALLSTQACQLAPSRSSSEPYSLALFKEVIGGQEVTQLYGARIENLSIPQCRLTKDDPKTPDTDEAMGMVAPGYMGLPEASALVENTTDHPLTVFLTVAVRLNDLRVATTIIHVQSLAPGEKSVASAYLQPSGPAKSYMFNSMDVIKVQAHPY